MKNTYLKLFVAAILFCSISPVMGQRCNFWFFGDSAGLDFTSGMPVEIFNSSMYSFEGTATISDTAGNLLMYTNGGPGNQAAHGAIWNSNDSIMPNGSLDSASGCNSSSQSSIIVPDPGNANRYYVFTTDCQENQMAGGFRFNLVDMTLDNGLGDVVVKDSFLLGNVAESIAGISHANGIDYWVVVHGLNTTYYAFKITAAGIAAPVASNIGSLVYQSAGQLTASCSSNKIGYSDNVDGQLCDFNNVTGVVSNYINLSYTAFGCAFSPSGRFLYMASQGFTGAIMQYDLTAANIPGSATPIGNCPPGGFFCNMTLGPDHKIYTAQFSGYELGRINNPDLPGTLCNYVSNAVPLFNLCVGGLPNFVNTFTGNCTITGIAFPDNPSLVITYSRSNHSITVFFSKPFNGTLGVIDMSGRMVRDIHITGSSEQQIYTDGLNKGIYLLKVTGEGYTGIQKIIL
jgi:hypothetical protein